MTGYDIYKRASALLGYEIQNEDTAENQSFINRLPFLINQILAELKTKPIENLYDKIELAPKSQEAVCYGTAMLIALSESDGTKNQIFANIYNAKRASALSKTDKINDVLPSVGSGGI